MSNAEARNRRVLKASSYLRIKICCISSLDEARMAVELGADAVGLVSEMPSGPGVIPESLIAEIARSVPPPVATFLLTCKQDANSIITQQKRCGVNTIQICDRISTDCYSELRTNLPGVRLVQVIHVSGQESVSEAVSAAEHVDAILLDSGNQKLAVKELGGTGRTHDWTLSRAICETVKVPVFLAGGLNAGNIQEAIRQVRPYGIDVCSGVRSDGRLDGRKLKNFFEAARGR